MAHKIVAGGTCDIPHSSALRTSQEVLQNAEERKLEAFLQAYRLAGTSIVKYENGVLLIELLTSFGGERACMAALLIMIPPYPCREIL